MSVKVKIPAAFRNLTDDEAEVVVDGASVKQVLENLESRYPGLKDKVYDDGGKLCRFVALFLNDADVRSLQGEFTPVEDGDEIAIVSAIAGG